MFLIWIKKNLFLFLYILVRIHCHCEFIFLKEPGTNNSTWGNCSPHCDFGWMQRPFMQLSRIGVSPVAHVLFVDGSTQMCGSTQIITKKNNGVLRNDFQKNLTRVPPRIEVPFVKYLHNRHIVWIEMKILMKNSPHRTIGKSKGRRMFARRTPWWSQHWSSHCLNVLTWSNGPRDSSSSSCRTCHVTIDFRSGTRANGAKLLRFRKACWVAITEHPLEK